MTEQSRVAGFTRRFRITLLVAAVTTAVVAALLVTSHSPFQPQYYYMEVAGSTDTWETIDLAKGQVMKMRFTFFPPEEKLVIVVRQVTQLGDGRLLAGYILKDEPEVGDGDIVTFKAPHSGTYMVSMRTRSGARTNVRFEYSLSD